MYFSLIHILYIFVDAHRTLRQHKHWHGINLMDFQGRKLRLIVEAEQDRV